MTGGGVIAGGSWGAPAERPTALRTSLDHRAIGVVHHPEEERRHDYVPSTPGDRYYALLRFGETAALRPGTAPAVGGRQALGRPVALHGD
jgi:hypothetical protein